jgi:hypothetical protein
VQKQEASTAKSRTGDDEMENGQQLDVFAIDYPLTFANL